MGPAAPKVERRTSQRVRDIGRVETDPVEGLSLFCRSCLVELTLNCVPNLMVRIQREVASNMTNILAAKPIGQTMARKIQEAVDANVSRLWEINQKVCPASPVMGENERSLLR